MKRIRAALGLSATAALVAALIGVTPAYAEVAEKDDPAHDKWVSSRDGVLDGNPQPSDVNHMLVKFKKEMVIVRLTFNTLHEGSASGLRYDVTTKHGPSDRFFGAKHGYPLGVYKSNGDGEWKEVCEPIRVERYEGESTGSAHHGRLYLNAPAECFVPNNKVPDNAMKVHAEVFDQTDDGYRYWRDEVAIKNWVPQG